MHLLIFGSEYVGKTTLATEMPKWMIKFMGLRLVRWHNHFVVPDLDGHLMIHAEEDQTEEGKPTGKRNTNESLVLAKMTLNYLGSCALILNRCTPTRFAFVIQTNPTVNYSTVDLSPKRVF